MKKNKWKTIFCGLFITICLGALGLAGWHLAQIGQQEQQIEQETKELEQFLHVEEQDSSKEDSFTVDWAGLQATNPNVVAWIVLPDTNISYPVVQGTDNDFYLNHTFAGAYNTMGAIFLDHAASPNFTDDNSLIYGHSVSDIGGMFTDLVKYTDPTFFQTHPTFWLLTPSQNYKVHVYALYSGSDEGAVYTTDFGDYQNEVLADIAKESMYTQKLEFEDVKSPRFISLSTCDLKYGFYSNQRYVLMGRLEEWNESVSFSSK